MLLDHVGVEGAADPFRDFDVAVVLRVGDRLEKILGIADVFGWTTSRGFGQARVSGVGAGRSSLKPDPA